MPSKRTVLEHLTRDELLGVVDSVDIAVPDRRAKEGLLVAVVSSKKATLPDILAELSRDRLKEICRNLGLDDAGKEKAVLIARLIGGKGEIIVKPNPAVRTEKRVAVP